MSMMYAVKEVSPIGGGKDGRFRNEETFGARGEGNLRSVPSLLASLPN